MGKAVARLSYPELAQCRWLLGAVLALLSFWVLLVGDLVLRPGILLCMGVLGVAVFFPVVPVRLPERYRLAVAGVVALLTLIDFFINRGDWVPSVLRLVFALTCLRVFSARSPRHDYQLILLCLVLVVAAGVLTVSIVFVFQIFFFLPLATAYLLCIHFSELAEDAQSKSLSWSGFSWFSLLRRVYQAVPLRYYLGVLFLWLVVGIIAALLFVLIPRVEVARAIAFLDLKGKGKTGFSEEISLRSVTDIVSDNAVALRVAPPPGVELDRVPYWRMSALDQYQAGRFLRSSSYNALATEYQLPSFPESSWVEGQSVYQEDEDWLFWLEGDISRCLPFLGAFTSVHFEARQRFIYNENAHFFQLAAAKQKVLAYAVKGMSLGGLLPASQEELALRDLTEVSIVASDQGDWVPYPFSTLAVPVAPDLDLLLEEWVDEIRQGRELSVHQFAVETVKFLQRRHAYSLESVVEERTEDPLINWMLSGSAGHCEYFSGAFLLLSRKAGFPTRVVTGFRGASVNGFDPYWVVRNRHAHAWNEVFDGEGNWFLVDATPGNSNYFDDEGMAMIKEAPVEQNAWAWWDSMRVQWYRQIVNFNARDRTALIEEAKSVSEDIAEDFQLRWSHYKQWLLSWRQSNTLFGVGTVWGLLLAVCLLMGFVFWRRRRRAWVHSDRLRKEAASWLKQIDSLQRRYADDEGAQERLSQLRALARRYRYGPSVDNTMWKEVRASMKRALR